MQAITTKFHGPTDHNGARITARSQSGRMTVGYGYDSLERGHDIACAALLRKLAWRGAWVSGGLPDGTGNCYVCTSQDWAEQPREATVNGVPISDLLKGL